MRYSPGTGGFYPEDIAYPVLPDDLMIIEDAYHAALMAGQALGQVIVADQNGVPQLAAPPPPDPSAARALLVLTFTQLLIGLDTEGWLTTAEADAWLDGTLPAPVLALIASLPANQQFAARARAKRPSVVERLSPLVTGLAAVTGKTDAELDAFFQTYAAI